MSADGARASPSTLVSGSISESAALAERSSELLIGGQAVSAARIRCGLDIILDPHTTQSSYLDVVPKRREVVEVSYVVLDAEAALLGRAQE